MIGLCDMCAFKQSDCKGNKDLEKVHCPYYKKPTVFNAKEASERIAEAEQANRSLADMVAQLKGENIILKSKVENMKNILNQIVMCKDCKYFEMSRTRTACTYWSGDPYEQPSVEMNDFCSYGERR